MCLKQVLLTRKTTKGDVATRNGTFFGYKFYHVYNDGTLRADKGNSVIMGKWNNADNAVIKSSDYNTNYGGYTSGFHIFLDPNDAAAYCHKDGVYLVEFTNIVGIGYNSVGLKDALTVIAKKMRVVKKLEQGKDF